MGCIWRRWTVIVARVMTTSPPAQRANHPAVWQRCVATEPCDSIQAPHGRNAHESLARPRSRLSSPHPASPAPTGRRSGPESACARVRRGATQHPPGARTHREYPSRCRHACRNRFWAAGGGVAHAQHESSDGRRRRRRRRTKREPDTSRADSTLRHRHGVGFTCFTHTHGNARTHAHARMPICRHSRVLTRTRVVLMSRQQKQRTRARERSQDARLAHT